MEGPGFGMQDPSFDPERRPRREIVVDDDTTLVGSEQGEQPTAKDSSPGEEIGPKEPTA